MRMFLVVGLGNVGEQYKKNRHNVGFMFADKLAAKYSVDFSNKFKGRFTSFSNMRNEKIFVLQPSTYMNQSGVAVQNIVNFFKLIPSHVFVVHDDLDIELGKLKIKIGGGSGGHNGLKSIDSFVGSQYWRIRIGISRPQSHIGVSDYVLQDFSSEEQSVIDDLLERIIANLDTLLHKGKDDFLCLLQNTKS